MISKQLFLKETPGFKRAYDMIIGMRVYVCIDTSWTWHPGAHQTAPACWFLNDLAGHHAPLYLIHCRAVQTNNLVIFTGEFCQKTGRNSRSQRLSHDSSCVWLEGSLGWVVSGARDQLYVLVNVGNDVLIGNLVVIRNPVVVGNSVDLRSPVVLGDPIDVGNHVVLGSRVNASVVSAGLA
ncbi:hypothetical protein BC939DRAFT_307781 [Gamsiella multidivaricata]|uniref:uncharacterized protein n=1 Tax=Gamsiella multidivaricata TaxID=101098 RepID=UPI00221FD061|nr:uncharacterized protein BC939DRAFT_307781 [Gamsiella multidivaricata]KAI7818116.1 hypothetical protein BC939DRAFT_307781 [Gamsiella multidivaricata]